MASAKMTRVEHSPPVDFSTWALPIKTKLTDMADASLSEVVTMAMKHDLHAYLPHEWNFGDQPSDGARGELPADPLTIYVHLPQDHEPTWSFSLAQLIEFHDYPDHRGVVLIRDGLAELDGFIAANAAPP